MSEKVFKAFQVQEIGKKVSIAPPKFKTKEEAEAEQQEEVYSGPSIEEIEQQIAVLRANWVEEERALKRKASEEADSILDQAKTSAFEIFKRKQNEGRQIVDDAKNEASQIVNSAKVEAETIKREAQSVRSDAEKAGYEKGYQEGFDRAFQEGKIEVERLVAKLTRILGETINKRNEIIDMSETQLIEISILVAKRVVKSITERDKGVVVRNIQEALRKVKGRAKVTIRINIDDLEIAARHKDEFYQMLDKIEGVTVLEDPNVDVGGCIIETDFGDIDARINTQLNEIETAIKEIEPIKGI